MPAVAVQAGAEASPFRGAVIENREMRTLRHQHYAFKAQLGGLIGELVEVEERLAPEPGVADGVQNG